ncbi:HAD-IA family hydrolase [Candidatus Daviesbacteria bacterium]|nr:HAD-IA family hydrolase [Candidatus Daviesbacteria bacterium]
MITTIIFDLSDVYLHGVVGTGKHIKSKIKVSDADLLVYELDQLLLGEITEDEYWNLIKKRHSWEIPVNELKRAVRKNFREIKGTRKIIDKLNQNGYRLGLLSNHVKEWIEYCEIKYKYHHLFHKYIYSYEVGFAKPSKKIFKLILKKLRVKPQECLFIDDDTKNISTAKKLGIKTIHFTSSVELKKKLIEHKIKI